MTKPEAILDLRNRYFTSWGGGRISSTDSDERPNENAILANLYYCLVLKHLDALESQDEQRFYAAVKALEVEAGLYNRNPGERMLESMDNTMAMISGASLFKQPDIISDIVSYGKKHWWIYDNTGKSFKLVQGLKIIWSSLSLTLKKPFVKVDGKLLHTSDVFRKLAAMRQPGEQAIYRICNGENPSVLQFEWLCRGMSKSKGGLLTWARIEGLRASGMKGLPMDRKARLTKIMDTWMSEWMNQGDLGYHFGWFKEKNHPIHTLTKGIIVK